MADPTTVTGLAARYRASDLTLVDNDPVINWSDTVGTFHLTQGTAARRPVYKASVAALGGKPAVLFDAVDDWLGLSSIYATALSQPQTYFVVYRKTTSVRAKLYDSEAGTSLTRHMLDQDATSIRLFANATLSASFTHDGAATVVAATYDTASSTLHKNGTLLATGNGGSGTARTLTVGINSAVNGEWFGGEIAEILRYNRVLTPAERAEVHSYIQDTYGITVADYAASGSPSGGSVASVDAQAVGAGSPAETASGGSSATVDAQAVGAGSSTENASDSGGSSATVDTTATGAGTAVEHAGGSAAAVDTTTAGAGTAAETASGGSVAPVVAQAVGGGQSTQNEAISGGSIATVGTTATGAGTASESGSGGSAAPVLVTTTGDGRDAGSLRNITLTAVFGERRRTASIGVA